MRILPLALLFLVAGCAATPNAPSLAPRAAETIDPRLPVPDPPLPGEASATLAAQLDSLVAQARGGDEAFAPLAAQAGELADIAGAKESESWVLAQQALSAAVAARAPVTRAVAEIDALGAQRVVTLGGIGAADLEALKAAAEKVAAIDNREAGTIASIQAKLAR